MCSYHFLGRLITNATFSPLTKLRELVNWWRPKGSAKKTETSGFHFWSTSKKALINEDESLASTVLSGFASIDIEIIDGPMHIDVLRRNDAQSRLLTDENHMTDLLRNESLRGSLQRYVSTSQHPSPLKFSWYDDPSICETISLTKSRAQYTIENLLTMLKVRVGNECHHLASIKTRMVFDKAAPLCSIHED